MLTLTNETLSDIEKGLKDFSPFWNEMCQRLSENLWLPNSKVLKKTDCYVHSKYLKTFINNEIDSPVFPVKSELDLFKLEQKKKKKKNNFKRSKEVLPPNVISATKKIRFYPEEVKKYYDMCSVFRRGYNIAVDCYNSGKYKDMENIRNTICLQVEQECLNIGRVYNSNVVAEAVTSAREEFVKVCRKNKELKKKPTGEKYSTLKFKKAKETKQTFILNRMPKSFSPCRNVLGKIHLTEEIPAEAIGKQMSVTTEYGEWYILTKYYVTLNTENQGAVRCIALDPGIRNFMTGFSENKIIVSGENMENVLLPMALSLRQLLKQKAKLEKEGKKFGETFDERPLWYQQRLNGINNNINKLKIKKNNIIHALHHELAFYLVQHFDVIFLPKFETKQMSRKTSRNISKSSVITMLALCHHQFKLLLKWYAKKYGKRVIDVNESFTSRTDWNGGIHNMGKKTVMRVNKVSVDRDINGARNIYIKQASLFDYNT